MPSSLAVNHSSALIFSTRPPVSVYGTGAMQISGSGFSRKYGYPRCRIARRLSVLSGSADGVDLPAPTWPTPFNRLFRQPAAVSLLRHHFPLHASDVILNVSSIGVACRLALRTRLTLIRLALIRNPWSFGERVSHPLYRYLYLHLLFQPLQKGSPLSFSATAMLPYRSAHIAPNPWLRYTAYARLLSMPNRSTSELLRTL